MMQRGEEPPPADPRLQKYVKTVVAEIMGAIDSKVFHPEATFFTRRSIGLAVEAPGMSTSSRSLCSRMERLSTWL
jgi:hypothetical protein